MLNRTLLLIIFVTLFTLTTTAISSTPLKLSDLIREVEDQYNGESSHSMTKMEVATETGGAL